MNTNIKIFTLCPIPEDQKPMTEYIVLKQNEFFKWMERRLELSKFQISFLFLFFNLHFFFPPWFFETFGFLWNLCLFLLCVLFWRWKQIKIRFEKPSLFYEEASWYDGQIWQKPFSILKNDRLLSTQQISPRLQKIGTKIFLFSLGNLVFLFLFLLK